MSQTPMWIWLLARSECANAYYLLVLSREEGNMLYVGIILLYSLLRTRRTKNICKHCRYM